MYVFALSAEEIAGNLFEHIVNPLMAAMLFVALLVFIIIAVQLIKNSDSVDRKELFTKLSWSIAGIFIITSVWTIIAFVAKIAESDLQFPSITLQYLLTLAFI